MSVWRFPMWRTVSLGIVAGLLATASPCDAQTVSGSFVADPGGTIKPTMAGAYIVRAESNPRQTAVEVILSIAPVDLEKAVSALNPHLVVINEQRNNGRDHILIQISGEKMVRVESILGKTLRSFVFSTESGTLVAELTSSTSERVGGRVFTPTSFVTRNGETVTLDLTFSTPVTAAPAGTSLPPGGGDPGNALKAFFDARNRADWPALKAALSPSAKQRFAPVERADNENRVSTLGDLNYLFPAKDPKITGGTLTGETAVLEVESSIESGAARLTLVRLIRDASGWRFDDVAFIGMVR